MSRHLRPAAQRHPAPRTEFTYFDHHCIQRASLNSAQARALSFTVVIPITISPQAFDETAAILLLGSAGYESELTPRGERLIYVWDYLVSFS